MRTPVSGDTAPDEIAPFDVCGPLPRGVTVLEASAGTGKTFTIAALAARYVAEGVPLDRLLLVTFTRMATGELRERVRDRLVSAEAGLARFLRTGTGPRDDDAVVALLSRGATAEVAARRRRLAGALAGFDAATIATTHGFCQHVLTGLGVAGDLDRDAVIVEDCRDLLDEVVDDLYVLRFHSGRDAPPFDRTEAFRVADVAVRNPSARLLPDPDAPGLSPLAAMRRRLAGAVRDEVDARKRRAGILTYDDLLERLRRTLADPATGAAAARRLRERYEVVLVDEFQDTDPIQWEILRRAFGEGRGSSGDTPVPPACTLVLIGDPKQAIYAFRGADVYAYLDAAAEAGTRATLAVNWRSDQGLLDAYDAIFGVAPGASPARLGHEGIAYRQVEAAEAERPARLAGAGPPLRMRILHRADGLVHLTPKGWVTKKAGQELVAADLAADLAALLSGPAEITGTPVRPGDVAVLVRTNRDAALVRDALEAVGVPAVINGAGSVFGTPVAREWLRLLEALERPTSPPRARSAALTVFGGWSASRLAVTGDDAFEAVHARLHAWAGVLRRRGVAALLETVSATEGLPARLLGQPSGERALTDLRHVGQLLHAETEAEGLGVAALTVWLRQRIAEAREDTGHEERSRRLESDAEAVQVLTIHRSKGLEFGVVYFPYLWDPGYLPDHTPPVFHDPDHGDQRSVDVGGPASPGYGAHWERYVTEQRAEELRLAYVALTRARHQAVLWWVGSWDSRNSPLGRLLFARDPAGNIAPESDRPPSDEEVEACLAGLAAAVPGRIGVERVTPPDPSRWVGHPAPVEVLSASLFSRSIDTAWRRTSYSAITSGFEERVGSEPEDPGVADEGDDEFIAVRAAGDPVTESALRAVASPLGTLPAGADVGTFVHRILEHVDFAAADLTGALARALPAGRSGDDTVRGGIDDTLLVAGLAAAIDTPLGPLLGEVSLRDIGATDRLDELAFEFPLAGGDRPVGAFTVGDVGALLARHVTPADPLANYPARLADPALAPPLRGYLSGSLDLVFRTGAGGAGRYFVVDYKTNRLAGPDEVLSAWHYRPAALAEAMQRAHYPLQALIYSVALHRYLRGRLPDYETARHLGGFAYLFLRGMSGPETPRVEGHPCGVFAWRPPEGLVEALSDLFDRGQS